MMVLYGFLLMKMKRLQTASILVLQQTVEIRTVF